MKRLPQSRNLLTEDDRELVDHYFIEENPAGYPYHVVAAFVLANQDPPQQPGGFSGTQSKLIQEHYGKYSPNGVDDDGLDGVGPLVAKK